MDGWTDRQRDGRTDEQKDQKYFFKGGKKVVSMKVALMSYLTIGGTNVVFLAIGGTYVDLIEGWTIVGRTNVGGRKVAASFV
jgi:hypothetical protein